MGSVPKNLLPAVIAYVLGDIKSHAYGQELRWSTGTTFSLDDQHRIFNYDFLKSRGLLLGFLFFLLKSLVSTLVWFHENQNLS